MTTPPVVTGMSMSGFKATTPDIAAASQKADTTAANVQFQLQQLRGYVYEQAATWLGSASQTFQALMTDFDVYATMLNQALQGISQGLHGNWVNYTASEEANIGALQKINGALPGGPITTGLNGPTLAL